MELEFFNLLFKIGLLALMSFAIPFVLGFLIIDFRGNISKRGWVVLSLISLFIMIITLLMFGISVTNKEVQV